VQYDAALARTGHAVLHEPQRSGSLARLEQVPEQLVCPALQLTPQSPPEQIAPPPQARPQAPQLALSVPVATSQPLAARPSQSA